MLIKTDNLSLKKSKLGGKITIYKKYWTGSSLEEQEKIIISHAKWIWGSP